MPESVANAKLISVLVCIPVFGRHDLVDLLLSDLQPQLHGAIRVVVFDNRGDFPVKAGAWFEVKRPRQNLRWIGATNWMLNEALGSSIDVAVSLNSDTRLSDQLIAKLVSAAGSSPDVAVAAPAYDGFWQHQMAREIPASAALYRPRDVVKEVPFCDGAAIAFSLAAVRQVGLLDQWVFANHGYGADMDYALRARSRGFRVLVTESCYVSHVRRASMEESGQSEAAAIDEIGAGMADKYGSAWREVVGLPDDALRGP